jgi:hypothetical protein
MQPYGFDIGSSEYGIVLKGLDFGVEGMRVGGQVPISITSLSLLFALNRSSLNLLFFEYPA